MSNYARIINNVVSDVSNDPFSQFHPELAKDFTSVPDNVVPGSIYRDGEWITPVIEEIPVLGIVRISAFDFKLLFTPVERVAINEAKATDALVNDFFSLIDDPRMTTIDLTLQSTKDIINHLVTVNILTPQRAEDILANKPV